MVALSLNRTHGNSKRLLCGDSLKDQTQRHWRWRHADLNKGTEMIRNSFKIQGPVGYYRIKPSVELPFVVHVSLTLRYVHFSTQSFFNTFAIELD